MDDTSPTEEDRDERPRPAGPPDAVVPADAVPASVAAAAVGVTDRPVGGPDDGPGDGPGDDEDASQHETDGGDPRSDDVVSDEEHAGRSLQTWIGWGIVAACSIFVFWSLHPQLIFQNSTPTGGDMGAHVWGPKFLTDHLLPEFRLTGWTQDWYAGFPAYVFYMVVPSLLIVWISAGGSIWSGSIVGIVLALVVRAALIAALAMGLRVVLRRMGDHWARVAPWVVFVFFTVLLIPVPYNIAFKLVTVSGLVTLPIAAFALARAAKVPFPGPPLIAVATLPFIYDKGFTILGGNGASTMAGEFAFSISLTLSLLYLAVLFRGVQTRRDRALGAVLLALTILCHLIPAIFAGIATAVFVFVRREDREPWWDANLVGRIVAGVLVLVTLLILMPDIDVAGITIGSPLPQWWFPAFASIAALALFTGFQPALTSYWRDPRQRLAAAGASLVGVGVLILLIAFGVLNTGPWLWVLIAIAGCIVAFAGWDWRAVRWLGLAAPVGILITGFWSIPFLSNSTYMNDMGWEKYTKYADYLMADSSLDSGGMPYRNVVFALAGLGIVLALIHRVRLGWFLALTVMVFAWTFRYFPQYRLWNARLLPFYYLALYLLAGLALALVIRSLALAIQDLTSRRNEPVMVGVVGAIAVTVMIGIVLLGSFRLLPGGVAMADPDKPASTIYRWLGMDFETGIVPDWARWNFAGLENKPAFGEFDGIVDMMDEVGQEHGCGRAMWEYEGDLQRFGTPMALMLLPYFTDGCIGSMEGLYFEASSTTPFHFLNQAELSTTPSSAQRDLPYSAFDIDKGVQHLQMMGVKYYMATSEAAIAAARTNADLTELSTETFAVPGTDGRPVQHTWAVFEVADSALVTALENDPVVVTDTDGHIDGWVYAKDRLPPTELQAEEGVQGSKVAGPAVLWYNDPTRWDVFLATSGPDNWPRAASTDIDPPKQGNEPVEVSDIDMGSDSISFSVDQVGVPVLVKVSYFPSWKVSGADGPYRVSPNFMVVVPTEQDVTLSYGYSKGDLLGWVMTIAGLVLLAGLMVLDARSRRAGGAGHEDLGGHGPDDAPGPDGTEPEIERRPEVEFVDAGPQGSGPGDDPPRPDES